MEKKSKNRIMSIVDEIRDGELFQRWKSKKLREALYYLKVNSKPESTHHLINGKYDFRAVNLRKNTFRRLNFANCDLSESDLSHGIFYDANLNNSILVSSNFQDSIFTGSTFENSSLINVRFHNTKLNNCDFSSSNLIGCDFRYANIKNINLKDCTLNDVDFRFVKNHENIKGIPKCIAGLRVTYDFFMKIKNSEFGRYIHNERDKIKIEHEFDFAISFAGENRDIASKIAYGLKSKNFRVFYDEFEKADLIGKNLIDHFTDVFRFKARFSIMLISKHYAYKSWATVERKSMQANLFQVHYDYIIPIRLDDTEIPGMLPTIGYIDYYKEGLKETIKLLIQKRNSFKI